MQTIQSIWLSNVNERNDKKKSSQILNNLKKKNFRFNEGNITN